MVNRKIKISLIENPSARQATFSKRTGGLLKKAHDLAILCDAEVGVIIFSGKGQLFQFASSSMPTVLERFAKACADADLVGNESPREETGVDRVSEFTQQLKAMQRNVIGDDLERLSIKELTQFEQNLRASLGYIRARKEELIVDQLDKMKPKVAEARNEAKATSRFVANLVNLHSSVRTGHEESERCERCHGMQAPRTDALPATREGISEQGLHT